MTNKEKLTFLEKLTGIKTVPKDDKTGIKITDDKEEQEEVFNKDYTEHKESFTISLHNDMSNNKELSEKTDQRTKIMNNKTEKLEKKEDVEEEGQLTIDVYQTADEIIIKSPVAGVKQKDLDVNITNDMVTIKGRRENDESVLKEDFFFQELYWGPFSRSVILPSEIDIKKSKAILRDGILTIKLPKTNKEITKKLSIELG